jgi:hypothetical protein
LLTLAITLLLWVRHPFTQTMLANIAMTYLSNELKTEIHIDRLEIRSLKTIAMKNFLIKDQMKDTLLIAGSLSVNIDKISSKKRILDFEKLELHDSDLQLKIYKNREESNLRRILNYFGAGNNRDSLLTISADTMAADEKWNIKLASLKVVNSKFSFIDENVDHPQTGSIDFKDVAVSNLNLEARDALIEQDTFTINIKKLSVLEKTGFYVDSLSGNLKIHSQLLQAKNLQIFTPFNDLDMDLKFSFESFRDFNDFINKVEIESTFRPSTLNLSEVGFFAPVMFQMDNRIKLTANIRGTVDNFKARNLKFAFGSATQFRGNIQMHGLPEITETFSHLSIDDFITTSDDIGNFKLPADKSAIVLPEFFKNLGMVKINGKFTGFYNDFVSYGNFRSRLGRVNTDLALRVNKAKEIAYQGRIETINFHAGKLFNIENYLGKLDLVADITGSGTSFEEMDIQMDGIIDSVGFKGIVYSDIKLKGKLAEKKFTGSVDVTDDNISFNFDGTIDYGGTIPRYNFVADVKNARLSNINLVNRDPSSNLSTRLNINFMGDEPDNLQGIIIIDSTRYFENGETYTMEDFTLSITRDPSNYAFISLYSDMVDAIIEGNFLLQELPYSIKGLLNQYLDTLFVDRDSLEKTLSDQELIFDIRLKDTRALSQLFIPELSVSPGTQITGGYNSQIENIFVDGNSEEIIYLGRKLINWNFDFYARQKELYLKTMSEKLMLTDSLYIDSLQLVCAAYNDSLHYKINWNNKNKQLKSQGDLQGYFALLGKNRMEFKLDKGQVVIADTTWRVNPANLIKVDTNFVEFRNLAFTSRHQGVQVNGKISPLPSDTLMLGFKDFDFSNFDLLLKEVDVDIDGQIDGFVKIANYRNSPTFLSDIEIQDLYMNGEKLGEANINSSWDPEKEAFNILGNIIYTGNVGQSKTFEITGSYFPNTVDNNFDIDLKLNNYKLTTLEPFIRSFSSRLKGLATGEFSLTGSKSKPVLQGEVSLMRTQLQVDYLNVSYYFADKVYARENLIWFDNMTIYDSLNNQAVCSGKIYHDYFKNFTLDLNFDANNLVGMNTTRQQNETFYGKAFASGNVKIHGPFDNLAMDIAIRSEKGTDLKIPASYSSQVVENDYIVFVNQEEDTTSFDPYDVKISGLSLNMNLDITQAANLQLFLPYQMGNIQSTGNGNILMNVSPTQGFTMEGEYEIYKGSFFLTLQNIINRNFSIKRGSRVSWTGDPYDAQMNVKAVYEVKTTLGEYGPPEDSATRVPVDCIITLSNNLLNPEIRFSIEFPDLKDDAQQYIYSRLDTNDQAMMSQQMISLLVLNSFYNPSGATGSVGFNTFSLVTNQLNNWLSQISNDFDIGINYRPGDQLTADELEVALSTQLFDNRVTIDGNVGVRNAENTQNTNNLVGEVTVEVKITPDGRFRAKAFNKSNSNYLYKNYSPYTQGVGIFYTKEFDRLKDLFRRKSSSILKEPEKEPTQDQTMLE